MAGGGRRLARLRAHHVLERGGTRARIEPSVEYSSVMLNDTAAFAREFLAGRRVDRRAGQKSLVAPRHVGALQSRRPDGRTPMPEELATDLREIMSTMRAMRRLKPDPGAGRADQQDPAGRAMRAARRQHPALALPGASRTRRSRRRCRSITSTPLDESGRAALCQQRAAAGLRRRALPAPARRGRIPDRPLPRGAGVDRRLPRRRREPGPHSAGSSIYGGGAEHAAWRRARSASARP